MIAGLSSVDPERLPLLVEVLVERPVALVHEDRSARDALEERRAADVVEVGVRVDERDRLSGPAPESVSRMRSGSSPGSTTTASRVDGSATIAQLHCERSDRERLDEVQAHVAPIIPLDSPNAVHGPPLEISRVLVALGLTVFVGVPLAMLVDDEGRGERRRFS